MTALTLDRRATRAPAWFWGVAGFGVVDALPGQLAILAFVVLLAVTLLATGWAARPRGLLR